MQFYFLWATVKEVSLLRWQQDYEKTSDIFFLKLSVRSVDELNTKTFNDAADPNTWDGTHIVLLITQRALVEVSNGSLLLMYYF